MPEQLQTSILGNWNLACNSGLWKIPKQSLQLEPRRRWDRERSLKKTEKTWFVNYETMREKEVLFSVLHSLHSNSSRQRTRVIFHCEISNRQSSIISGLDFIIIQFVPEGSFCVSLQIFSVPAECHIAVSYVDCCSLSLSKTCCVGPFDFSQCTRNNGFCGRMFSSLRFATQSMWTEPPRWDLNVLCQHIFDSWCWH